VIVMRSRVVCCEVKNQIKNKKTKRKQNKKFFIVSDN
jgi:hypothetical protein